MNPIKKACELMQVKTDQLFSGSRLHDVVMARHFICYWFCTEENLSLSLTGRILGIGHASVIHALSTVETRRGLESDYNNKFNEFLKLMR